MTGCTLGSTSMWYSLSNIPTPRKTSPYDVIRSSFVKCPSIADTTPSICTRCTRFLPHNSDVFRVRDEEPHGFVAFCRGTRHMQLHYADWRNFYITECSQYCARLLQWPFRLDAMGDMHAKYVQHVCLRPRVQFESHSSVSNPQICLPIRRLDVAYEHCQCTDEQWLIVIATIIGNSNNKNPSIT